MLSKSERETVITFNELDTEALIDTTSRPVVTKLDKLCEAHPDTYRCIGRDAHGAAYNCPKRLIRFGKPVSEARRDANRRAGAKAAKMRAEIQPVRSS